MNKSNPGFALPKGLVALAVLLMAVLLVLKIAADRNDAKLNTRPEQTAVPAATEAEIGQPLPEEAKTQSSASFAADSAVVAPAVPPARENLIVPADVSEKECLLAFKSVPAALLRHFEQNYDSIFVAMDGFRADAELSGLFSDYVVCSILGGAAFSCTGDYQQICLSALNYEFLNSAFNNRPDDGKCSQFIKEAFMGSGEAASPGFCGVVAAALTKRTAPDCKKLGTIKDCESAFVFLKGRQACSMFRNEEKKECLLSAALAAGDTASPEGWLPKVMRSRSQAVCAPLGEKLAVSFCTSKLRRQLISKRRAIAAIDEKKKALGKRAGQGK